jgi:hypothetical protein
MGKELIDSIVSFFKKVWNFIKKIAVSIVSFFKHIVTWAQAVYKHLYQIFREDIENIDIVVIQESIEKNLKENNYSVTNAGLNEFKQYLIQCAYNRRTGEIVDWENSARIISFNDLDEETKRAFKNKDMIILK